MMSPTAAASVEMSSRLLQAHGFWPEADALCWSKSGRTQDAIAELDAARSRLHLMVYNSCEDHLILEANVDLDEINEPMLDRVIGNFDLTR
jgi:hypothetical protein